MKADTDGPTIIFYTALTNLQTLVIHSTPIRNGDKIQDTKLKALSDFVIVMINKRGNPSEEDVREFFDGGYNEKYILDIILAISIKTISNYTNHIFHTELDSAFKIREWSSFKVLRSFVSIFRK